MEHGCLKRILSVTALAVVISAGPMAAQARENDSARAGMGFIQQFDQDGDGRVAMDEFAGQEDQFDDLDVNGDGYIDASESPQGPARGAPRADDLLAGFDSDGDGALSVEEFPGPEDLFESLDADADSLLSAAELAAGRPGPPPGVDGFAQDDADQDGRVSQEEFSGPEDLFTRLDADGDGYISRQEARPGNRFDGPGMVSRNGGE